MVSDFVWEIAMRDINCQIYNSGMNITIHSAYLVLICIKKFSI